VLRIIFDTNVWISSLLYPNRDIVNAIQKGLKEGIILTSDDVTNEIVEVLSRPKFDKYISFSKRKEFLTEFYNISEEIQIIQSVKQCRDPKDDKFLELALNSEADFLITGDNDLLEIKIFHRTHIVTPKEFLNIIT